MNSATLIWHLLHSETGVNRFSKSTTSILSFSAGFAMGYKPVAGRTTGSRAAWVTRSRFLKLQPLEGAFIRWRDWRLSSAK